VSIFVNSRHGGALRLHAIFLRVAISLHVYGRFVERSSSPETNGADVVDVEDVEEEVLYRRSFVERRRLPETDVADEEDECLCRSSSKTTREEKRGVCQ